MNDLPKVIYARREQDTDGTLFVVAAERPKDLNGEDGDIVGVYELVKTKTLRVTAAVI